MDETNSIVKKIVKQRAWKYYIQNCLPSKRVHLLSGPSGAGKTSWLFQAMDQWTRGEDVLGFKTTGQDTGKFFYIAGDKTDEVTAETMHRMGVPEDRFSWRALADRNAKKSDFFNVPADTRILAIDGVERLVADGRLSDFRSVEDLSLEALAIANARDMAIIFMIGSPKMKKGEEYAYGRERAIGSTAWGRFADTIFNMNILTPDSVVDTHRVLFTFPRNHAATEHRFIFDSRGQLIEAPKEDELNFRTTLLNSLSMYEWKTTAELLAFGKMFGASESTVHRALKSLLDDNLVEKEHGKYKSKPSPFLTGGGLG